MFIRVILTSCPNFDHLQLHVLDKNRNNVISAPPLNHSLRRFTLWSHSVELTFNDIDVFLTYTPNVQYFYLQTERCMSFVDLTNGIVNRPYSLFWFNCYIKEMINKTDRVGNLITIHQLHSSLNRIKCTKENDNFRIFAT